MTDDTLSHHFQSCRGGTLKSAKTINGVLWLDFENAGFLTKLAFTVKGNTFVSISTTPIKKAAKPVVRTPLDEKERALKGLTISAPKTPKGAKKTRPLLRTSTAD